MLHDILDTKADAVTKGDRHRDVSPTRTFVDEDGFTHYVFNRLMFKNIWYNIPDEELELFIDFANGGSRSYPSDGNVPCDIVAGEARSILNKIVELSNDSRSHHYEEAREALERGKTSLVRGTLKLYLGKYTTRDWRRKRFTDDIDFWVRKIHVLHHVLRRLGWLRNYKTREWQKSVGWRNPLTGESKEHVLIAANDLDQLLDFGAGSYLEGGSLKQIFQKKIKRGHEVDLSDLINVVMVKGMDEKIQEKESREKEWKTSWEAFEAAANMRNTRTTSNIISLCRYALAIADHIDRVSQAIVKYNDLIFDKSVFPDEQLKKNCLNSIHWLSHLKTYGSDEARKMFHEFYHEQAKLKIIHAKNLRNFAPNLLKLLNSKYTHLKIVFEIEDLP
jgi:hypothetical protein